METETTKKMNLGQKIEYPAFPTIAELKEIVRTAHQKNLLMDLKIKDYPVVQDYLRKVVVPRRKKQSTPLTLHDRLLRRLVKLPDNIKSRECSLYDGRVVDYDPSRRLWITFTSTYLYTYKEYKEIRRDRTWLCGKDDGGYFRHQIPATITKIDDALDWITPVAIKKAIAAGKKVLRQGEVWFVEFRFRQDNTEAIPSGHNYNPATRDCNHPEHGTLHIPYNFRAYINKSVGVID